MGNSNSQEYKPRSQVVSHVQIIKEELTIELLLFKHQETAGIINSVP